MTRPILPCILRDDKVLTPEIINTNFRRLLEQQRAEADRRWSFDSFVIPFRPSDENTPAAQLTCAIRHPNPYRIIGRELYVYGGDGETMRVTTTGVDVNVEAVSGGAAVLKVGRDLEGRAVAGSTEIQFVLESDDATWTIDQAWVVVHVAYDRFEGVLPTGAQDPVLASDAMARAEIKVNASLVSLSGLNTALAASALRWGTQVIMFADIDHTGSFSAVENKVAIPDAGGTVAEMAVCGCAITGAATASIELYDGSAVSQGASAFNGAGASTFAHSSNTAMAETLPGNDFDNDYHLWWGRTQTNQLYTAYAMLYWT